MAVDKVNVLKIDKDCFVHRQWILDYLELIILTCRRHGTTVISIKKCNSRRKGNHFYIEIDPPVEATLANRLQWLLGDDCDRVDFNRARICSGLNEWNKLFERIGAVLRTVYRAART
jgi:hypothetical protein